MKPPLFTYCRLCGDRWGTLSLFERHKPGCPLLRPNTGFANSERPRPAQGTVFGKVQQ